MQANDRYEAIKIITASDDPDGLSVKIRETLENTRLIPGWERELEAILHEGIIEMVGDLVVEAKGIKLSRRRSVLCLMESGIAFRRRRSDIIYDTAMKSGGHYSIATNHGANYKFETIEEVAKIMDLLCRRNWYLWKQVEK